MLPRGTSFVQNCWVVDDLDTAMQKWLACGVGPFFTLECRYEDSIYRGEIVPLRFVAALAQAGPIQIELIQQLSPGPSAYRDVVPQGGTAFHHMCKITDDFAGDIAALKKQGIAIAAETVTNGVPSAYADTRAQIGCMLEFLPPAPILLDLYAVVAKGAREWDGREPIRPLQLG